MEEPMMKVLKVLKAKKKAERKMKQRVRVFVLCCAFCAGACLGWFVCSHRDVIAGALNGTLMLKRHYRFCSLKKR